MGDSSGEVTTRLERLLWNLGYQHVAGVDEVGLGPLAGPVVAAAVVFSPDHDCLELRDSKKLSPSRRSALDVAIRNSACAVGVGVVEVGEVDRINVRQAGLEAMRLAVAGLDPGSDYLLVDACTVPGVEMGQSSYIAADAFIYSVAAASIVAKVYRDRLMVELGQRYPGYGFERHMGYGTAVHMEALSRLGPCPVHRQSFAPVRKYTPPRGGCPGEGP